MQLKRTLLAFNHGIISRFGLARVDLKRSALSAERENNWMPRVLGSMMLRPGLQYLGAVLGNGLTKMLPFVFATNDTALVEITEGAFRAWVNDVPLSRSAVSSAIVNGNFDANLANWTPSGGSTWAAGGYLQILSNGVVSETCYQAVAIGAPDQSKEHALRIVVERGPVLLRVGSTAGADDYFAEAELGTGTHSLAFVPTGATAYVYFLSRLNRIVLVSSCNIEAAGIVSITAPWLATDLRLIRMAQSADVMFLACKGYQQRRIERRSASRSWSIVLYQAPDGPFRNANVTPITLTASVLTGNGTLTASAPLFKSTQVGGLYTLTSSGQRVTKSIAAQNTFTDPIKVTGIEESRRFSISITGAGWTATVTLQRSLGVVGNWEDVSGESWTANVADTYADGLDNQIVYYRLGVKTGDYTIGTVVCELSYTLGSITGVARITAFTSNVLVNIEVLKDLGDTVATLLWSEGSWSNRRGWPTAVAFYEGRLIWSGKNGIFGSISDAFDGFDPSFVGDAGPFNRTVGSGPVDNINWILPLQRLMLGADGSELSVRSTLFDQPLSPTNFSIKEASTQGSASVAAVKVDNRGVYVQRGGTRAYELVFDPSVYDYTSNDLTAFVPEICRPGIVAIGVQRQIDTRIHFARSDGLVAILISDHAENVLAWVLFETDGVVEDVVVLPGLIEDQVYYVVRRIVQGATVRYLEKWALESDCIGGALNKQADSFVAYTGSSVVTVGGFVSSLSVVPGAGYVVVPTLALSGGGGTGAAGTVTLGMVQVGVALHGTGYAVGDVLTLVGGTYTRPAKIEVLFVFSGGQIGVVAIVDGGDYTAIPAFAYFSQAALFGGTGAGGTVYPVWGLANPKIIAAGTGYTSAPTVTPSAGPTSVTIQATSGVAAIVTSGVTVGTSTVSGPDVTQIGGLEHLEGREVIVWADGKDLSPDVNGVQTTYTVTNGIVTLNTAISQAVVGLPYTATFVSTKLAYVTDSDTGLNQRKKIAQLGLILLDAHSKGIKYGTSDSNLQPLPLIEAGKEIPYDTIWSGYDADMIEFPGEWGTDERLFLVAKAPRPVKVLAAVIAMEIHGKS